MSLACNKCIKIPRLVPFSSWRVLSSVNETRKLTVSKASNEVTLKPHSSRFDGTSGPLRNEIISSRDL